MAKSSTSLENKIKELEKLVRYHNKKYFIDNDPEISDEEFDMIYEKLRKLKPDSPALFEIVGTPGDVYHPNPMLSIDKKFTHDKVIKWIKDTKSDKFIIEPKYDGMAARYQGGTLSTRGNGIHGENITARLEHLNVIGKLPKDPKEEARGEVTIPLSYFKDKLAGTYKNPRNAVVGIVKAKDIKPAGIQALLERGVHFVLYGQTNFREITKETLMEKAEWESLLEETLQIDYPLDGVVIKVVDQTTRNKLGATNHHEKWQIAYKLPGERKWSTVREIKDQVGRTGRVTSVAVIDPIDLSGATITNVTLHNVDFVKNSGIDIGSKVEVTRSGEVIPFITRVENKPHLRSPRRKHYSPPTHCPICKTKLRISGKYLECPDPDCAARKVQEIEYFFKTLGVDDLGAKTIEKFINAFNLNSVVDFYQLNEEKITNLDGFGAKSAQNILANIQNTLHKQITPSQLLQALGIRGTGPATSRWITNHYGFDNIPKLTPSDLESVDGIGPIKAKQFVEDVKKRWHIVRALQKMGLAFKEVRSSNSLKGLSFCITGKQGKYSRGKLIELITQYGGEYKTSVTKDLDYLIAGEDAGSKLKKAKIWDTKIISETEFIKLLPLRQF